MNNEVRNPETEFGLTVRSLRRERKLSQARLGKRAGLHRTYVGGIERGERNPSLKNILAMAAALRVSPPVLFSPPRDQTSLPTRSLPVTTEKKTMRSTFLLSAPDADGVSPHRVTKLRIQLLRFITCSADCPFGVGQGFRVKAEHTPPQAWSRLGAFAVFLSFAQRRSVPTPRTRRASRHS